MPEYYMPYTEKKSNSKWKWLIILLIIVTAVVILKDRYHICTWEDCPYQFGLRDQHSFNSKSYEELTDGWAIEMTHYINPDWTYAQCKEYVSQGYE